MASRSGTEIDMIFLKTKSNIGPISQFFVYIFFINKILYWSIVNIKNKNKNDQSCDHAPWSVQRKYYKQK